MIYLLWPRCTLFIQGYICGGVDLESSFLVLVALEDAPPSPLGSGERGEVGSLSSMSESGDLRPDPMPGGWGVPPLEVVLRSWGLPTLLSAYLQDPTLAVVRGAVRGPGVTGPAPREAWGDLGLGVGPEVEEEAGYSEPPVWGAVAPIMLLYWPA